ncbi:MAG: 2-amino-4-hydroxy-6-hydroxymethyldihydropteridine diphosphokinase, partial [Gammaproteobacteria bacterium]|nr:2-amino-4-hydroxy-6-hydroxymethyldihydropteridine diphosphokinase [Gammaproteobacteria bacterium]
LDEPIAQIGRALDALASLPQTIFVRRSPLYENDAVGPAPQPSFINGVAELETELGPHQLLDCMQEIEASMGRIRGSRRWEARLIDLDLVCFGDREISDDRLTVPHPEIGERRFVLLPLWDIAPDLVIPGRGPVLTLLERAPEHAMKRIPLPEAFLRTG